MKRLLIDQPDWGHRVVLPYRLRYGAGYALSCGVIALLLCSRRLVLRNRIQASVDAQWPYTTYDFSSAALSVEGRPGLDQRYRNGIKLHQCADKLLLLTAQV